jgi:hypothetical protein
MFIDLQQAGSLEKINYSSVGIMCSNAINETNQSADP